MSQSQTLLLHEEDGVLRITLNRPDRLNAFNAEMSTALIAALEAAHASKTVRAVLLTGAGRGFCAGQDLGDRDPRTMTERPDLGETIETYYTPVMRLIRKMEQPVICAVNGVAAGAGANIALACDIVLAARSAKFIQAFVKIGLIPDCGGTWTLARRIGEARAKGLALTGMPLDAETAAEWGLIWRMVEDDALMSEAEAMAKGFATGPTRGIGLTKQAIHAAATNTMEAQLDLERDLQREAGRSDDYAEGVAAFFEKRPPVFKGA